MRPIDADALVEAIKDYPYGFRGMIYNDINAQPTIDVPDRKVGKWKPFDRTWGRSVWACDACGETVDVPTLNGKPIFDYCPWCGAEMDVSDNDVGEMERSEE